VYNSEKYVAGCVNSIINQDFTDFEIILYDDGSTDRSLEICNELAANDSRIKVYSKKNGGISDASNCVLKKCTGKYIFLMDNDDEMCENALSNAFSCLSCNGFPDILCTNYLQISGEKVIQGVFASEQYIGKEIEKDEFVSYIYLSGKLVFPLWVKFIRREFWENSGVLFNSKYNAAQDADVTVRIMRKAETIVYKDFDSVKWYHPRGESVTTSWKIKPFLNTVNFFLDNLENINDWNISKEKKEELFEFFSRRIRTYSIMAHSMNDADREQAFEFLENNCKKYILKVPLTSSVDRYIIVYAGYHLLGIKRTSRLLHKLVLKMGCLV